MSNADIRIGSNRDINKDHKNLPLPEPGKARGVKHAASKMHLMKSMDKPVKDHLAIQHEQTDNPKMLAEIHNDDKLAITFLIVGAALVAYHFS